MSVGNPGSRFRVANWTHRIPLFLQKISTHSTSKTPTRRQLDGRFLIFLLRPITTTSRITCTSTWTLTWSCTCTWSAGAAVREIGFPQPLSECRSFEGGPLLSGSQISPSFRDCFCGNVRHSYGHGRGSGSRAAARGHPEGQGCRITLPVGVSRRLPRLRDVPDDGGGAAPLSRFRGAFWERFLAISMLSPVARAVDRLLAARSDSAVLLLYRRRGASFFPRCPPRPRTVAA